MKSLFINRINNLWLFLVFVIAFGMVGMDQPAQSKSKTSTAIGNDISSEQWWPEIIEDFEKNNGWKGIPTPYDPNRVNSRLDQQLVDGKPGDLKDTPSKKVFGIKFQFRYPGYNFITIFPPTLMDKKTGKEALDPVTKEKIGPAIPINGVIRKMSVWVMSQGKKYTLEGYLRDWKGNTHRIVFKYRANDGRMRADLNFIGWRPMIADIPVDIPQEIDSYPKEKGLKFVKFIVRATPHTSVEPVYLFFDQIKVLTNRFDVHFDGAQINTDWGGDLTEIKGRVITPPDK